MKERPIPFRGPMVRAILDGSKTQTRRVAKPRHGLSLLEPGCWSDSYVLDPENRGWLMKDNHYGIPGDRLWVRETWSYDFAAVHAKRNEDGPFVYAADGNNRDRTLEGKWRPSIFMPRAASRILLEITDVRVQRLREISEEDARAEGIEYADGYAVRQHAHVGLDEGDWIPNAPPVASFANLWESINGADSWAVNPWVWAITFRRVS